MNVKGRLAILSIYLAIIYTIISDWLFEARVCSFMDVSSSAPEALLLRQGQAKRPSYNFLPYLVLTCSLAVMAGSYILLLSDWSLSATPI